MPNPRHKRPESPGAEERDFVEREAEHLISIGTGALEAKARERLGAAHDEAAPEFEAPPGGGGLDAPAVANKVLKEAAAELQRREGRAHGHTEAATEAAFAQRVASGHCAPGSAEERVAARVRERFAGAGPALAGVNPDAGLDSAHGKGERLTADSWIDPVAPLSLTTVSLFLPPRAPLRRHGRVRQADGHAARRGAPGRAAAAARRPPRPLQARPAEAV